jgi:hypothetical protein
LLFIFLAQKSASHESLIQNKLLIIKKYISKLKYEKIKKSIIPLENANIYFFYSINLSLDMVYNEKNIFWITALYRKMGRKNTFDFTAPYIEVF